MWQNNNNNIIIKMLNLHHNHNVFSKAILTLFFSPVCLIKLTYNSVAKSL